MSVHWIDVEELAREMLNLEDDAEVEKSLWDTLEVSFESFHKIVERLVHFTPPVKSALAGKTYKGFVKDGRFIIKVET